MTRPHAQGLSHIPVDSEPQRDSGYQEISPFANIAGPFTVLPIDLRERLLSYCELLELPAGTPIVRQYHRGDYFYLLLSGQVEFHISIESLQRSFSVGQSNDRYTPIGWSAFRPPHRYGTSVSTLDRVTVLKVPVAEVDRIFAPEPSSGALFLEWVFSAARSLLTDARARLVAGLRGSSQSMQPDSHPNAGTLAIAESPSSSLPPPQTETESLWDCGEMARCLTRSGLRGARAEDIPSEESMVTNAAPRAREVLSTSPFFSPFPDAALDQVARLAQTEYFYRGQLVQQQGTSSDSITLLSDGRVRSEHETPTGGTVVLGFHSDPGEVLGGGLLPRDLKTEVAVRATRDGSLLRISRTSLSVLFKGRPELAILFQKRMLWLLSTRLRATRARLVSEAFDQEVLAVENLIEQARTELSVSSPLHKVPHLLKAPVTLSDALSLIDQARSGTRQPDRGVGKLAHELLLAVRREQRFFASLQAAYEQVVAAPAHLSAQEVRRMNAENFIGVFSQIPHKIEGLEYLPSQPGHIFVFNHLKNHEYNTLPNGFQLTLDSHFIGSMILHRTYRDPGVRVVRHSRAEEYGHHAYYSRLGHVSVYTRESDLPSGDKSARFANFIATAAAHLRQGTNLALAPEGTSLSTEESPGAFKAGAFRLALAIQPEPLIVPIAVAHFDRRLNHNSLAAVVQPPFKMSDRIGNGDDPAEMRKFLDEFQTEFSGWVRRAARLAKRT